MQLRLTTYSPACQTTHHFSSVSVPNLAAIRDYTNPSDIQIKVFDGSFTFFSPGRFYGGLSVTDIQTDNYQSHLRNKLVAEAFYLTNNPKNRSCISFTLRKPLSPPLLPQGEGG
jgi:hypothetical protein